MKNLFVKSFLGVVLSITAMLHTYAQESFAYQAVIRNAQDELVTNKEVNLRFSLINDGKTYYVETQKATTNQYGNIDVKIGAGQAEQGAMADVPWNTLDITLKVEVDEAGDKNFITLGETKISPAPYAMYATTAGSSAPTIGASKDGENLFEVTDRDGNPVFVVTPNGIVVYVDDTDTSNAGKAARSGFLVTGRTATKAGQTNDYFSVTADGTHVYVDNESKNAAARSGFLITGRTATKAADNQSKAQVARTADSDLFAIDGALTTVYVDEDTDNAGKEAAARSGFLITGRTATKGDGKIVEVNADHTNFVVSDFSVLMETSDGTQQGGATEPVQVRNVLTINGGQVEVNTDITVIGDVVQMVEAEELSTGEESIAVNDALFVFEVYDYNQYLNIGDDAAANYALMAIHDESSYELVQPNNNSEYILFFDENGNITKQRKKAVILLCLNSEGEIFIRSLQSVKQSIVFGLMNADNANNEPYQFVKLTANIDVKDGKPYKLAKTVNGTVSVTGELFYGEQVTLTAEPNEGYLFKNWGGAMAEILEPERTVSFEIGIDTDFDELVATFVLPVLYVDPESADASDDNSGLAPNQALATLAGAIDRIYYHSEYNSQTDLNWQITLVSDAQGAQLIEDDETRGTILASSILITGDSGDEETENAKLYGKWNGEDPIENEKDQYTVLSLNTTVPVTIENLTITGGYAVNGNGGGINIAQGTVTIAEGVLISKNTSVYTEENTGCGGGIYLAADAYLTMNGGEISDNKSYHGGGVYCDDRSTFYMTGGTICDNQADLENGKGGGIHTRGLLMTNGTAVIGKKDATEPATAEKHSNIANQGGGVYSCSAYGDGLDDYGFYFGWKSFRVYCGETDGGIFYNYATGTGGGVYSSFEFELNGKICYNSSPSGVGVYKIQALTIRDYAYIPVSPDGSNIVQLNPGAYFNFCGDLKGRITVRPGQYTENYLVAKYNRIKENYYKIDIRPYKSQYTTDTTFWYVTDDGLLHKKLNVKFLGCNEPIQPLIPGDNAKATKPNDPTKDSDLDYRFKGWYTYNETDGYQEFDFDDNITGDMVIYALWDCNIYVTENGTGNGTIGSPFGSIADAVNEDIMNERYCDYIINVKGNLTGAHEISGNDITASKIILQGQIVGSDTTTISDSGGLYEDVLTINTSVPVSVEKLKLAGGYRGIYVASHSNLSLENVLLTNNSYGITVNNGTATLKNVSILNNKTYGVYNMGYTYIDSGTDIRDNINGNNVYNHKQGFHLYVRGGTVQSVDFDYDNNWGNSTVTISGEATIDTVKINFYDGTTSLRVDGELAKHSATKPIVVAINCVNDYVVLEDKSLINVRYTSDDAEIAAETKKFVLLPTWKNGVETEWRIDDAGYIRKVKETDYNLGNLGEAPTDNKHEYYITNEQGLKNLANWVNGGNSFSGFTIKMLNNVSLSTSFNAPIGTGIMTNSNGKPFEGTFDGCGYKITGLSTSGFSTTYPALFGYVRGTIKNLTVSGTSTSGGIVGCLGSWKALVENCTSEVTINGSSMAGGIVAVVQYGTVSGCVNDGEVYSSATSAGVGGIVGAINTANESIIESCTNKKKIKGVGLVGGICGAPYYGIIRNCANLGDVEGTGNEVGGIAGLFNGYEEKQGIENCYNAGNVEGTFRVGGITGWTATGNYSYIANCYNSGNVTANEAETQIGGIVGYNSCANSIIENCYYLHKETTTYNGIGEETPDPEGVMPFSNSDLSNLCKSLNDWVDDHNTEGIYKTWKQDENGFPVFK
jgi:hypothetical protein